MKWLNNVYSLVGLGVGSKCVVQSKKKYQGHKFCITVSHSQCVCVCVRACVLFIFSMRVSEEKLCMRWNVDIAVKRGNSTFSSF